MISNRHRLTLLVLVVVGLLCALPVLAEVRLVGSLGARGYGYEDAHDTNHLWVDQTTRFSLYKTGTSWSLHFSGGYIGDNADDFSDSGHARFLKGYVQYGNFGSRAQLRAGRFFLYRGVALGVMDGVDASYRVNRNVRVALHAGMMGPMNRRFEFEEPDKATSFGGELKFRPTNCRIADQGNLGISYTHQKRDGVIVRHLIGVNTLHRWGTKYSLLNTLQLRPSEDMFQKFIARFRMSGERWFGMAEFGALGGNYAFNSWFSDFSSMPTTGRIRLTANHYVDAAQKWAAGLEGQMLLAGETGFRGGVIVTTPWGQAGYRFAGGEQAQTAGPWVMLHADVMHGVEMFAHASQVTYHWDAFDIESTDLISAAAGVNVTPGFLPSMTLNGEFQIHQTPEFKQDRRAMGGIVWRFDTGRTH